MDLSKLTTGDKVVAGSGIALLIFNFFPQFGKGSYTEGAGFLGWLAVLIGIVMVAEVVVSKLTTAKLPDLPIGTGQLHLILGGAAAALEVLQLALGRKYGVLGVSITLDRKFGLFLAVLAAIGLAVGGFLKSKEPSSEASST